MWLHLRWKFGMCSWHLSGCEGLPEGIIGKMYDVCVYVCLLFPFILDIKFVGRTSRGHTGFLIHLPSAMGALIFARENDSAIPFPR